MLYTYIGQKETCPFNAIYMPHMPITSCAYMRKLHQYTHHVKLSAINNVIWSTSVDIFNIPDKCS